MVDCVFCDIIAGRAPASIVYRDDRCTAFMDINPINAGHALVVPNVHAGGLADLDPRDGEHMFTVAQELALALRENPASSTTLPCQGVNLHLADGSVAGQEVWHVHLHVIPRHQGDGFGLCFGPYRSRRHSRSELDEAAATIREALGARSHPRDERLP